MELNDIYDENRVRTGRVRQRGGAWPWPAGEYGLVVTVWVYDGKGKVLLTRRAPGKTFAGTWENSGGAALAGEDSLPAVQRELWEETGIRAEQGELEFLATTRDGRAFYDHYCLHRNIPIGDIKLLPGETDGAMWAGFEEVHRMIEAGQICQIIAEQFLELEPELRKRQVAQEMA